jgi:PH (Pleckstrin Homology) domain-containing protein
VERVVVSEPHQQGQPARPEHMTGPVPPVVAVAADSPVGPPPGTRPGSGKLQSAWRAGPDGTTIFRLMPPLVLWWVWVVFAVANIADLAIQSHDRFSVEVIVAIVAITGIMFACALRPRVISDDAGLVIRNPFRDYSAPWGAITGIFVGDSVEIGVERGEGRTEKTIYSWALYSPRRARARSELRVGFGNRQARERSDSRARRRYQVPDAHTFGRAPQQAKDIASKHPSHIMAGELARRCETARAHGASGGILTARWAWLPIAAVIVPIAGLVAIIVSH